MAAIPPLENAGNLAEFPGDLREPPLARRLQ